MAVRKGSKAGQEGGGWRRWLKDAQVAKWFQNNRMGSPATADCWLQSLTRFLTAARETPLGFIKLRAEDREDRLQAFIADLAEDGLSANYMRMHVTAVASWMEFNKVKLERQVKVPEPAERKNPRDDRIPTVDELRRTMALATVHQRALLGLLAFAGLRPQSIGNWDGTGGLHIRDLPDAHVEDGLLMFDKVPTRILVCNGRSKTRKPFFTLLGEEGCHLLGAYMRERADKGEKLGPDSPLVRADRMREDRKDRPFLKSANIGKALRRPMLRAGVRQPAYVWRSYFSHGCMMAEREGVPRDWSEFWMGHSPDIARTYRLKRLPEDTVEAMREAYRTKVGKYLETASIGPRDDPRRETYRLLLEGLGYSAKALAALDGEAMAREIVPLLQKAREGAADGGGGPKQTVVALEEVGGLLAQGWRFVSALGPSQAVVEGGQ